MVTTEFIPLPVTWRNISHPGLSFDQVMAVTARVSAELDSWLGTPYMAGQRSKGIGGGVFCIGFVCSVLDALYGFEREPLERLPNDTSMHNPVKANAALRKILRIYEPNERVEDGSIEPGDIIIVGVGERGGPSHAKIVGARRNALYHATVDGVCTTGILERAGTPWAVYRSSDKDRWLRC